MERIVELVNKAIEAIEQAQAAEELTDDERMRLATAKADLSIAKADVRLRIAARDKKFQTDPR